MTAFWVAPPTNPDPRRARPVQRRRFNNRHHLTARPPAAFEARTPSDAAGSGAGRVYLILGGTIPTSGSVASSAWVTLSGSAAGDGFGTSISPVPDSDGDGRNELLVGAPGVDGSVTSDSGAAYVFEGGFSMSATPIFTISGSGSGEALGTATAAGDLSGDGYADIVVGAPYADSGGVTAAGVAYVYFGSTSGFSSTGVSSLTGSTLDDHVGMSVALAGDVDGAGGSDLLIGAPGVKNSTFGDAGSAYLVFGPLTSGTSLEATEIYYDDGNDAAGTWTRTIGDIDNDGYRRLPRRIGGHEHLCLARATLSQGDRTCSS